MAFRSAPSRVGIAPGALFLLALLVAVPAIIPSAAGESPTAPHPAITQPAATNVHVLRPLHPPAHPPALLRKAAVNPNAYYNSEPAPMGITDFGVNATGTGYTYQTSAFYGVTTIHKLQTYSAGAGTDQLSIQLNIVLTFTVGGASYAYWVQDVAFLDTTTASAPTVGFENNIWNFTSPSSSLDSNSVTGNGSLYQVGSGLYVYIAGASSSNPGNGVTLSLPTQIGLLAAVTVKNGQPEVLFQYRDGYGLVTYDNALFPFAKGATNINYTVDGTNYNSFGLFNDAELILGGPGNGYSTSALSAQLSMSLAYFNGRNFQSVPNAYNFGSDTAETISNLSSKLGATGTNGSLMDNLSYSTSGLLKGVYDDSYAGHVEIITQAGPGTVKVNATTGIAFTQGPINLTMAPGNYSFALYSGATKLGTATDTLVPGGFLLLYIDSGTVSTIDFVETGLPTGTSWSISLGASTQSSTTDTIQFLSINGTIGWRLIPIPGFVANVTNGQLSIAGQGTTIDLNFTELFYPVQIFELGLPTGTNWSVVIANQTHNSSGAVLSFQLPNGTYLYTVGHVAGYWVGSPASGVLSVVGLKVTHTLNFRPFTYVITIAESGLPPNTFWGVEIGGTWTNGSLAQIMVSRANGSYPFVTDAAAGYIVNQSASSVEVSAAPSFVNVTFIPYAYVVQFIEQGLANGTLWGVQVGSTYRTSTTSVIRFALPNGTYAYQVNPLLAYVNQTPLNSSFQLAGQPATISVVFGPHPALEGYLLLSVDPSDAILLINGTEATSPNGTFDIPLLPGSYHIELLESGYLPFFQNITIIAGGHTDLAKVTLHQVPPVVGTKKPPVTNSTGFPWIYVEIAGVVAVAVIGLAALAVARGPRRPEPPR